MTALEDLQQMMLQKTGGDVAELILSVKTFPCLKGEEKRQATAKKVASPSRMLVEVSGSLVGTMVAASWLVRAGDLAMED